MEWFTLQMIPIGSPHRSSDRAPNRRCTGDVGSMTDCRGWQDGLQSDHSIRVCESRCSV